MTKKPFKKEYDTPMTEVCDAVIAGLLCQSDLNASTEDFVEDGEFTW